MKELRDEISNKIREWPATYKMVDRDGYAMYCTKEELWPGDVVVDKDGNCFACMDDGSLERYV